MKAACLEWLRLHGFPEPIHNNTAKGWFFPYIPGKKTFHTSEGRFMKFGRVGSGDLLFFTKSGRWVELETKSTEGEQREKQIERQAEVEAAGGLYILAHSVEDLAAHKAELLA